MSHTNQTKKIKIYQYSLTVIIILILIISYVVIINGWKVRNYNSALSKNNSVGRTEKKLKKYKSDFLKIEFSYPEDFTIEEKYNSINLENADGIVQIDSVGTNYSLLNDYLDGLERLNRTEIINREHLVINGVNAVKATYTHKISKDSDDFTYYFYPAEWKVISISTESKNLQSDLDAIAQSFSYSP